MKCYNSSHTRKKALVLILKGLNDLVNSVFVKTCFQVENLLISSRGQIKLCDFGSSTTTQVTPDDSWTALQRSLAEDEVKN